MESKQERSSHGAFGLAGKYVTCPEIYQLETQRVFNRSWICACHVSQLGESGLLPFQFEEHNLFVACSDSGVKVFRNYCRHRGSQLVTEKNCESLGQRIQCPYHAWTYERDGRLAAAPNMDGVEGFDCDDFRLMEIASEVVGGFVWICLEPSQTAVEFLQPVLGQFSCWSMQQLQVVESIEYEVPANWKLIFQNYSECYHCPSVHPALNRLTPYKDSENEVLSGPILGGPMQLSDAADTMSMDGQLVGRCLPGLSPQQNRSVHYFTICPTVFLSTHPDYVLLHRLQRMGIGLTRVTCDFLFHPESFGQAKFDATRAVEFWDMTNRQDWEVCELAQAGMSDAGYVPGPYSNLESVLAAFDQCYLRMLG